MENKRYDRFYPGKEWLDTDGKRIQAHGGSIMYANGKYYLYGENKEKSLPSSGIWHWGVRLYSSDDLYNWKDEGIIFKASIFDADGNLVKPMFKYEETFYPSLESLIYATGEGNSPFYALTDADYTNENITNDELLKMGITPYEDGACYYFSAEIKHHDDGAAEKKPMEYAIMRNNIYSLAVSDIKTFGFSSLNINDQIEDSTEETENLYMTLKARILPWIVRFNNVEF